MEEPAYTYQSQEGNAADKLETAYQKGVGVLEAALLIAIDPYKEKLNTMKQENTNLIKQITELQNKLAAKEKTIADMATQIKEKDDLIATLQKPSSHSNAFTRLIQAKDKQTVLDWLHDHIDGRKGKDVAVAIMKAFKEKALSSLPSEKVFKSEFTLNGSWRSISKYLTLDLQSIRDAVEQLRFN